MLFKILETESLAQQNMASVNRVDQNGRRNRCSIASLQQGLGAMGDDLSGIKTKLPQDTRIELRKFTSQVQMVAEVADKASQDADKALKHLTKWQPILEQQSGIVEQLNSTVLVLDSSQKQLEVDLRNERMTNAEVDGQLQAGFQEQNLRLAALLGQLQATSERCERQGEALDGNVHLYGEGGTLSAALLNAALAGAFVRNIIVRLVSETVVGEETNRLTHNWAQFEPVISSDEDVDDADVAAPSVIWTDSPEANARFVDGELRLTIAFDTDANVTKHYAVDDEVSVTVKVAADDKWHGLTVTEAVVTFTVVA